MLIFSVIWPYIKLLMMVSGTSLLGRFVAAGCTTFLYMLRKEKRVSKGKKQNMFLKGKKSKTM
jgi:hypothetical protein